MLIIQKNENGEFIFVDIENKDLETILDLNTLDIQLNQGQQDQLKIILEEVINSEQYENCENEIKNQIEDALTQISNFKEQHNFQNDNDNDINKKDNEIENENENNNEYNENQQEQYNENDLYDQLNNELINQRYPEVHQTNKLLDDNIQKIKARVQLLQLTEQRNIIKTKSLDRNALKILQCKQNKFEKETQKERLIRLQREQIEKRKKEIQKQRQIHLQILEQSKGRQGKMVQDRILQTREFRTRIQKDYFYTIKQVEQENQKSYQRIKKMEQSQSERIQKFLLDKQVTAQKNYQKKVEDEFQSTMNKQEELEQLEKVEQQLLERIKVTQQLYNESSIKLETIKQQSYRLFGLQQN